MKGTESECGVATARICGAVDYARTLAPPQGPGTHQAWLYGNIKRAVSKIFAAEGLRGGGNGLDFALLCALCTLPRLLREPRLTLRHAGPRRGQRA